MNAIDEVPFDMPLLHFRRTFVEKMFAIHAKVEMLKESGQPIGSYARHYYDLSCLAVQPEVITMLKQPEYETIREDYERVSLAAFPRGYRRPPDLRFATSDALFPSHDLQNILKAEYERQCRVLCYATYPSWDDVMEIFENIRNVI